MYIRMPLFIDLLLALGTACAIQAQITKQKRRVLFTRAADLVRQLVEARDQRELTRLQQRLHRVEVLIVDELGFVPFDCPGGELNRTPRFIRDIQTRRS